MILDLKETLCEPSNKLITTKDFYEKVWGYVKNIPILKQYIDKLDYAVSSNEIIKNDIYYMIKADISTGANEGIYLTCYIRGEIEDVYICTFKSLSVETESYLFMGSIAGAMIQIGEKYLSYNL